MATFIIEHLEPRVGKWVLHEYSHIAELVGKQNLLITNTRSKQIARFARTDARSVKQLAFRNACVLDPDAARTLTPADAKRFNTFIFGGILGDYPPRKRTNIELGDVAGERRNLGKEQMSTDTAVHVVKRITEGVSIEQMRFQDTITIPFREGEEIELPYRYLLDKNGKPHLPLDLVQWLKRKKGF